LKLLLFSDIHSNLDRCQALVELAKKEDVEVVIGAGDLGNLRTGLSRVVGILKEITKPVILTPGNSESETELSEACKAWPSAIVLHASGTRVGGVDFWGIGGGIPVTPFGDWSFDFTEEQAIEMLAGCPKGGVLVSHSPPKGVVDVSSRGKSLGSVAVREAIIAKKPRLVVCGHIHESAGKTEMLEQTPVVNAGPGGVIWEL
jgi:Icc-related predicted phosphoesterase